MGHVAQHVADDVARNVGELFAAADEKGVEVEVHQLRVVIEHFLEVRHEPFGIDGIAMEPAADLVVHTAGGHPFAGVEHHLYGSIVFEPRAATQEKRRFARTRKFRRAAEAAVLRVVVVQTRQCDADVGRDSRAADGEAVLLAVPGTARRAREAPRVWIPLRRVVRQEAVTEEPRRVVREERVLPGFELFRPGYRGGWRIGRRLAGARPGADSRRATFRRPG